ncbi:erythromycin esterase family protein [Kribbella sp.]|uniref:erythromycin esterase family protein n=1 Tax=Kribbella sp. TaxID=1871183 RepID=UPI002D699E68|nr:erythromycin esterase family protein [Kribbella sp.]HZX08966.1 erythromycin esterase family protein [Kribbella sp.]
MTGLSEAAVHPLELDGPLDDLTWLDDVIGAARVVAIGESSHYNHEFLVLRHRVLRYLVERHGFTAYAMESGFPEGRRTDAWVRGGEPDELGPVLATGLTSLMGFWTEMRDLLEWLRQQDGRVGFYGIDLPGSVVSTLPGLELLFEYLAVADPEFEPDPGIRDTAGALAVSSPFSAPAAMAAYGQLEQSTKDAFTAGVAGLVTRMAARRLEYVDRTSRDAYGEARCALAGAVALDALARAMAGGDRLSMMNIRDATMADTVEWILGREERVVLAAHNGHVQRRPGALPGMPPMTPLGMHLAERLGKEYAVIGTTMDTGQILTNGPEFYTGTLFGPLPPAAPDSIDGLLAASHAGPFGVDLRGLSDQDVRAVRAAGRQRVLADHYGEVDVLTAYDALLHVPVITPARPDEDALRSAPADVQGPFEAYLGSEAKKG